jgi:putative methyltransferase (TIGR04325 family)
VRSALVPYAEYVPEGWSYAETDSSIVSGYASGEAQLGSHIERWSRYVSAVAGPGPIGVNHELPLPSGAPLRTDDLIAHNTLVSFAYVLALAARGKPTISMLDWGGAIGHYCVLGRAVLPFVELDYSCRDAPELCAYGRAAIPDATFYESDEESFVRTYDLVVVSSSLAWNEDWRGTLGKLAAAATEYVYVARLPVTDEPAFVVVHRTYSSGSSLGSLGWVLSKPEFLTAASGSSLRLMREFISGEGLDVRHAPSPIRIRGFLFRKIPVEARS